MPGQHKAGGCTGSLETCLQTFLPLYPRFFYSLWFKFLYKKLFPEYTPPPIHLKVSLSLLNNSPLTHSWNGGWIPPLVFVFKVRNSPSLSDSIMLLFSSKPSIVRTNTPGHYHCDLKSSGTFSMPGQSPFCPSCSPFFCFHVRALFLKAVQGRHVTCIFTALVRVFDFLGFCVVSVDIISLWFLIHFWWFYDISWSRLEV